jgi:hypothetical protein
MKLLGESEVWFLTGSQDLYGDETLRQVAVHSEQIATGLGDSADIPVRVVFKPVVKSPDGIAAACLAGLFTWGRDAEHAADNAIALEAVAAMAAATLAPNPGVEPVGGYLLDRHYDRKHGAGADHGQPGGTQEPR